MAESSAVKMTKSHPPSTLKYDSDSLGLGQFGDNHKVKLGKNRSKTNGVKLSKMASGLWVSLRYFPQVLY